MLCGSVNGHVICVDVSPSLFIDMVYVIGVVVSVVIIAC